MSITKRSVAEFFGTFWLVFGGCGAAVLAAGVPELGIGYAGVSLAFGLTVLTMAFAIGHISGCHLNPAVTLGLLTGKRFPAADVIPYIIAQVLGAIAAAYVLYVIASGMPDLRDRRIRVERSRRALSARILDDVRHRRGNHADFLLPDCDTRRHR